MSRTTDAAIEHQNREEHLEGYNDYCDEQAARRWFKRHPQEALMIALQAAKEQLQEKAN